jgi:hypothetical protein
MNEKKGSLPAPRLSAIRILRPVFGLRQGEVYMAQQLTDSIYYIIDCHEEVFLNNGVKPATFEILENQDE